MDDTENEALTARFEFTVQLHELLHDFLDDYETKDNLNQPTLLDFADWVDTQSEAMANKLGVELDEMNED